MASSNTNTNNQSADPYTQKNLDQNVTLKERVEDLVKFVEKCKFCMMTTKAADSGLLASRCMALAGTVRYPHQLFERCFRTSIGHR